MKIPGPDQTPDYLVIGHITRDLTRHGPRIGGTAAYAALLASRAGLKVGVVTSTAGDLDLSPLKGIAVTDIGAPETTTFRNIQTRGGRKQIALTKANLINLQDIPAAWQQADIIHLAPVLQEVPPGLGLQLPNACLGLSLQGWLRDRDDSGRIRPLPPPANFPDYSARKAVGVVSLEDLGNQENRLTPFLDRFPLLYLTRGSRPLSSYRAGEQEKLPVTPLPEVDATGAGDIFTAALLISYCSRSSSHPWSARPAAALAGKSVGQRGLDGVPSEQVVHQHLKVNQVWEKSIP